ncbi:MAG TPA: PTS sugar transporter subunit IIA [Planctomycetota bacterium]|jgi:PTS system nitrogen regulatory IIA component|nr:PTS sugar transporter subunit IIA [Planctomycetota bacterium]
MDLSLREAAALLQVPERTVTAWVRTGRLPAYRRREQIRFNRVELLEWATKRGIKVSPEMFDDGGSDPPSSLAEALGAGGIHAGIEGSDKPSALRSIVGVLPVPAGVDRETLYQMLLAREALASTGVGNGIAIPHPRNPIVLHVDRPSVTLCFLSRPVDFGSLDGKPVSILFTVISPRIRDHLQLLSRLAFALLDEAFARLLQGRGSPEALLARLREIEASVSSRTGSDRGAR